jgi:hypothetical protein
MNQLNALSNRVEYDGFMENAAMATPYKYPFGTASDDLKRAVFNKGVIVPGYDAKTWRTDITGHFIKYSEHGVESDHGWEIDHIKPKAKGGSDDLSNLQPLWWKNNREKSDTYPWP